MKKIDLLRDLQELDSTLDHLRLELEQCRAGLGDEGELVSLRETLTAARANLKSLQSASRDLDMEIETRTVKRKANEKKLYDGSIKIPKDLASLSQEVEIEKQQISKLEDQSLLNMEAMEVAVAEEAAAAKTLAERERAWKAEQAELGARCSELSSQESDVAVRRQQTASLVDDATLKDYERIRRMRGGVAVVPVQRGACQGCRVSLSSVVVQRARSSAEPVACQSCGRLLYLP